MKKWKDGYSFIKIFLAFLVVVAASKSACSDPKSTFDRQCSGCHTIEPGQPFRQGPPLNGVFGRKAGSVEKYKYSKALTSADVVWDEQHLDEWLTNSQKFRKGTIMAYRQERPEVRQEIIEYLKGLH